MTRVQIVSEVTVQSPFSRDAQGIDVSLDDATRENVLFVGGKVTGVSCPACEFESRDIDIEAHTLSDVTCPQCEATILTEEQKSDLRRAHKL